MRDDTTVGDIIVKGRVVNQQRIDELAKIEEDRKSAAVAFTAEVAAPTAVVEQRAAAPTKLQELEKKVEGMEGNIAQILALLQQKK